MWTNSIEMGPNCISPESVKNMAYVGQKRKKFEQKEVRRGCTRKMLIESFEGLTVGGADTDGRLLSG